MKSVVKGVKALVLRAYAGVVKLVGSVSVQVAGGMHPSPFPSCVSVCLGEPQFPV